jgi:hypothetical protein
VKTKIHSKIMDIEVDGSTVKYRFRRNNAKTYEIRGVSGLDLATLRAAVKEAMDSGDFRQREVLDLLLKRPSLAGIHHRRDVLEE